MRHKNLILAIAAIIIAAFVFLEAQYKYKIKTAKIVHVSETYDIRSITPISGNEFDISTMTGLKIHAILDVATLPEAKAAVLKLLNSSSNPKVTLIDRVDKSWKVSIDVKSDGVDINISKWLKSQKLVYSE